MQGCFVFSLAGFFWPLSSRGTLKRTKPLPRNMTMDRLELSWNEFRKMHKGQPGKEISKKWKLYKAGEYDVTVLNEVTRSEEETKKLEEIHAPKKKKKEKRSKKISGRTTLYFTTRGIL